MDAFVAIGLPCLENYSDTGRFILPPFKPADRPRPSAPLSASDCTPCANRLDYRSNNWPTGLASQRAYAYWERHPVALRPDQLLSLAQALNVSVDDLVGTNGTKKRGAGPTGKMKQLFEAASRLPRSQQQKITALLEPFIAHHAQR